MPNPNFFNPQAITPMPSHAGQPSISPGQQASALAQGGSATGVAALGPILMPYIQAMMDKTFTPASHASAPRGDINLPGPTTPKAAIQAALGSNPMITGNNSNPLAQGGLNPEDALNANPDFASQMPQAQDTLQLGPNSGTNPWQTLTANPGAVMPQMSDETGGDNSDKSTGAQFMDATGNAAKTFGAMISADQAAKQYNQNLGLEQSQVGNNSLNTANSAQANQMRDLLTRAQEGTAATQLNPYAQQNDLFKMALKGALASGGPIQAGANGSVSNPSAAGVKGAASQFLNNDALSNAASNFYQQTASLNPNVAPPNLAALGLNNSQAQSNLNNSADYSRGQYNSQQQGASNLIQQALQNALQEQQTGMKNQNNPQGTGIWSKVLGGIAAAAPYIAMAL